MVHLIVQRHVRQFRRRFFARSASTSAIVLAAFALILVAMPVSYKAGTDAAHPHTVFQAILDEVHGETHHHPGERTPNPPGHDSQATQPAIFLALNVPLSSYAAMVSPALAIESMLRIQLASRDVPGSGQLDNEDIPQLTSVHGASEAATALPLLATVLALLLVVHTIRRLWFSDRMLRGIQEIIEVPPPRTAPLRISRNFSI